MDKVYLVSRGCYNDYQVLSVWSTKSKARAELRRLVGPDPSRPAWSDKPRIEPYDLDRSSVPGYGCFVAIWCSWWVPRPENAVTAVRASWHLGDSGVSRAVWSPSGKDVQLFGAGRTGAHAERALRDLHRAWAAGALVYPNTTISEEAT